MTAFTPVYKTQVFMTSLTGLQELYEYSPTGELE